MVELYSDQEPPAAHFFDHGRIFFLQITQTLEQVSPLAPSLLGEFLLDHQLDGGYSRRARSGISSEGGGMQGALFHPAKSLVPDLLRSGEGRDRRHSAAQRFPQAHNVRHGRVPLAGKCRTCAGKSGLDLVENQECLIPGTEIPDPA